MFDRYTHLVVKEHQKALENRIRTDALLRAAGVGKPPFQQRVLLRIGGVLVSAGQKLQKRYEPTLYFGTDAAKQVTSRTSA